MIISKSEHQSDEPSDQFAIKEITLLSFLILIWRKISMSYSMIYGQIFWSDCSLIGKLYILLCLIALISTCAFLSHQVLIHCSRPKWHPSRSCITSLIIIFLFTVRLLHFALVCSILKILKLSHNLSRWG